MQPTHMRPHRARMSPPNKRPRSYAAPMYVTIECVEMARDPDTEEWVQKGEKQNYEKVFLAKVGFWGGYLGGGVVTRAAGCSGWAEHGSWRNGCGLEAFGAAAGGRRTREGGRLEARAAGCGVALLIPPPRRSLSHPLPPTSGPHHAALGVLHPGGPQGRGADGDGGVPLRPGGFVGWVRGVMGAG